MGSYRKVEVRQDEDDTEWPPIPESRRKLKHFGQCAHHHRRRERHSRKPHEPRKAYGSGFDYERRHDGQYEYLNETINPVAGYTGREHYRFQSSR